MNLTNYLENQLRTHLFRTGTFAKPAALWFALHTADPGEAGSASEVAGGAYARVQLNPGDANWSAEVTDGETKNLVKIEFPAPTANWGVITHVSVRDASVAGNTLLKGALTTPKTVNSGDPAPQFPISEFVAAFD